MNNEFGTMALIMNNLIFKPNLTPDEEALKHALISYFRQFLLKAAEALKHAKIEGVNDAEDRNKDAL